MEELHELVARFDVPYIYLGKLRHEDVLISGTDWHPELPNTEKIFYEISQINEIKEDTERALTFGLYVMRTQPFKDGNKRIGLFIINKILIENGRGIFNVPVEYDGQFKQMLVDYYESGEMGSIKEWIIDKCMVGTTRPFDQKVNVGENDIVQNLQILRLLCILHGLVSSAN